MKHFVPLARRLRHEGRDLEEVMGSLREAGATMIDTVKVIREIEAVSLGQAKELVDASITWSDRHDLNDQLRKTAIEALGSDLKDDNQG